MCVCVRCAKGAVSQCDVCMRALRVSCPLLSVAVVVAIEATPSCIDHGVRAIEALGRQIKEVIHYGSQVKSLLDLT